MPLQTACDDLAIRTYSDLEKEGLVWRFAFTWELAWKVLKDYLDELGAPLEAAAPRPVIRAALSARLLDDVSVWLAALDVRNGLAHTYSKAMRDDTIEAIVKRYIFMFKELHEKFRRL